MRVRFTLRVLFGVVSAVAVFLAASFGMPSTVGILVLSILTPVCAAALVAAGVCARGRARAIAFAAAIPQICACVQAYQRLEECLQLALVGSLLNYNPIIYGPVRDLAIVWFLANLALSCLAGLVAVGTLAICHSGGLGSTLEKARRNASE